MDIDGLLVTGNGTGIVVGNNSILRGNPATLQDVLVTGSGSLVPIYNNFNNYYVNGPANSNPLVHTPSKATQQQIGNVTLGSGSTFKPLLTGEDAAPSTLFNFDSAATYPFATPPDAPVNGIVATPYGALFNWSTGTVQDGNGQIVIAPPATNGYGLDFAFGANNRPTDTNLGEPAGQFVLLPTDISNYTNLDIVIKLLPSNESKTLGIGLFDFRGNSNQYVIDLTQLNTSTYTTVSINLLSPSVNLDGPDNNLDLTNIAGYVFGGDQGSANGQQDVPMGVVVDEFDLSSRASSVLQVTGTVNLGGATLDGSVAAGFSPTIGQQFTIIDNDGADAVVGTFAGAAEGGFVSLSGNTYQISYVGGDGNDVVLTRMDAPGFNSTIVGRHIFYNQSAFDGNNAGVTALDDNAIATDKSAYFPGSGIAPLTSITSFQKGINGIMIDVAGTHGELTTGDFIFKVGSNNTPSSWSTAPAPTTISVRPGAGESGSDRVELIWANNVIQKQWLEVIVKGNDAVGSSNTNTGLAASDTFFFGNIIGDTFLLSSPVAAITNATDEIQARANGGALVAVTNIYDFNRDRFVNATDQIIARSNGFVLPRINITNPPAAPEAAPAVATDDGGSAVASALAISSGQTAGVQLPRWLASRLASVDLNSGPIGHLLTHLAEANTPRSHALLVKADQIADALDLDHSLLDSLLDDLDLA